MDKAHLRARMRARRRSLDKRRTLAVGEALSRQLPTLDAFRMARHLGAYLALPGEAPTANVIAAAHRAGMAVSVPAWCRATQRYAWARLWPDGLLEEGPLGVRQPRNPFWTPPGRLDAVLVPGLAFDGWGRRLGQGGGHYDRLLARLDAGCRRVALAFDWQIVDRVPAQAHDEVVHWIVTETQVLPCFADEGGNTEYSKDVLP